MLVRADWLRKHAQTYPQWQAVIEKLITTNAFVVIPAKYGCKDGGVEDSDLMVIEQGVKGPPSAFRINGNTVECVNYPGSTAPMTINEFFDYVAKEVACHPKEDDWLQHLLSQ